MSERRGPLTQADVDRLRDRECLRDVADIGQEYLDAALRRRNRWWRRAFRAAVGSREHTR